MRPTPNVLRGVLVLSLWGAATGTAARGDEYKILVTGATVRPSKQLPDGPKPWDAVGKPDVYVVLELGGNPVFVSGPKKDTLRPRWFTAMDYWRVTTSTPVRIILRDADAAKFAARVGVAGVAVHPQVPDIGKRLLNDALLEVDTDDPVAVWSGTLQQLIDACGGTGKEVDVLRGTGARERLASDVGLQSLSVCVLERPDGYDLAAPKGEGSYLGLTAATIEREKRESGSAWDVGIGPARNPDPYYLIYVNGSPVLAGAKNDNSFAATWEDELPALRLGPDDRVAIAVLDADSGTLLAKTGKHALLFSGGLSVRAQEQLYKALLH